MSMPAALILFPLLTQKKAPWSLLCSNCGRCIVHGNFWTSTASGHSVDEYTQDSLTIGSPSQTLYLFLFIYNIKHKETLIFSEERTEHKQYVIIYPRRKLEDSILHLKYLSWYDLKQDLSMKQWLESKKSLPLC